MSDDLKNILIIKPSSLGDIVLALPALSALRRSFPKAKISWLVKTDFAPLLEKHPHLDGVIYFDRRFLGRAWFNPFAFGSLMALVSKLRQMKFDVVFDFQGLFRTASLGWLSGCKKRFGMANARELAIFFYTHKVQQNFDCIHLVDYYLKIIKAAGASNLNVEFVFPQNLSEESSAKMLLKTYNIGPNSYVVFVPGSTDKGKCWPVERFAILADKIFSQYRIPIVATGSGSEKNNVKKLQNLANVPIANLAGKTSLCELIALLKSARLVVSNDTGPGHISAALGTPLVLMYSWSNPARIAPYGRTECMVAREPYGRGLKIKSTDSKHNIKNITVDEVYGKVREQLNRTGMKDRV